MTDADHPYSEQRERPAEKFYEWWNGPVLSIDTETTSADPLKARIVQLSCLGVYPDGRQSPNSYTALINPGEPIPAEATRIHGITDAEVQACGIPLTDALYELLRRLEKWGRAMPVVIYNATYDWPLIHEELGRTELVWVQPLADCCIVDPLVIERKVSGRPTNTLPELKTRYGITGDGEDHTANADALAAARILFKQVAAKPEVFDKQSLVDLQTLQATWYREWRDAKNAQWARRGNPHRIAGEWPFGDRRPRG